MNANKNIFILVLGFFLSPFCSAALVSLDVNSEQVQSGETLWLDLVVQDPFESDYAGDTLFALGFDLNYDETAWDLVSYEFADGWDDDSGFFSDTDFAASHFPGVDDLGQQSLVLASFELQALKSGSFEFNASADSLTSFNQGLFYIWQADVQAFDAKVSVSVNEVPLPSSAWLFMFALSGLGLRKIRNYLN